MVGTKQVFAEWLWGAQKGVLIWPQYNSGKAGSTRARRSGRHGCALYSSLSARLADAGNLGARLRTAFFPLPTRWRRPSSEGAGCGRRKPGRCWGVGRGAAGEGPGAAGWGWQDAVPGKHCWLPVRKAKHRVAFPSPPVPPMYASLGSGPVAALPASVPPCPLGSWSSGGGRGCVRQERKRRSCVRSSVRGANVWQVSEAASFGVSSFGRPLSALPRRYLDPSGAQPDPAAPLCPRPTPSPPRALFRPPVGPWLCRSSVFTQWVGVATPDALRTFPGS